MAATERERRALKRYDKYGNLIDLDEGDGILRDGETLRVASFFMDSAAKTRATLSDYERLRAQADAAHDAYCERLYRGTMGQQKDSLPPATGDVYEDARRARDAYINRTFNARNGS